MSTVLILQYGLATTFAFLFFGAAASAILGLLHADRAAWRVSHLIALVGSGVGLVFALATLGSGVTLSVHVPFALGTGPALFTFIIDPLAAFFIAIICAVAIAA